MLVFQGFPGRQRNGGLFDLHCSCIGRSLSLSGVGNNNLFPLKHAALRRAHQTRTMDRLQSKFRYSIVHFLWSYSFTVFNYNSSFVKLGQKNKVFMKPYIYIYIYVRARVRS
jgi:hypothetical protein